MSNGYIESIKNYTKKRTRIWELDFLRGFCALLMVFDHTMYNLSCVFYKFYLPYNDFSRSLIRFATSYWASGLRLYGWNITVAFFVLLCGISTGLSRNNLFRGLRLAVIAYIITCVTMIMDKLSADGGYAINFGVLHMLSACILVYALCVEGGHRLKLFRSARHTYTLGDFLSLCLFALASYITLTNGIDTAFQHSSEQYAFFLKVPFAEYADFAFGIKPDVLYSSDYIPMLPWLAIFLAGAMLSRFVYSSHTSLMPHIKPNKSFVSLVGRHTLILYVAHQPIIYFLLALLGFFLTGKFILF